MCASDPPTSDHRGAGHTADEPGGADDDGAHTVSEIDEGRDRSLARARRGRMARRFAIVVMAAFVVVGLLGGFGYRQASARVRSGDLEMVLSHPLVTRGGLPAHWSLEIRSLDGEPLPPIEVRTTAGYFDLLDHHDLRPQPDAVHQDSEVRWEYAAPGGSRLVIALDARTQPDARWRYQATTTVLADGEEVGRFAYRTTAVP